MQLSDIDDDLQTRLIRSAVTSFEFTADVEGVGPVCSPMATKIYSIAAVTGPYGLWCLSPRARTGAPLSFYASTCMSFLSSSLRKLLDFLPFLACGRL